MLEYVKELQGIIGVFAGLIFSLFIRNLGTVRAEVEPLSCMSFVSGRPTGKYVEPKEGKEIFYEISGVLLLENSAENMKAIRNVRIITVDKTITPHYYPEGRDGRGIGKSVDISHVNVPGKGIETAPFTFGLDSHKRVEKLTLEYEVTGKRLFKTKRVKLEIK